MNEYYRTRAHESIDTVRGAVVYENGEWYAGPSTNKREMVLVSERVAKVTYIGLLVEDKMHNGFYAKGTRALARIARNAFTCHSFAFLCEGMTLKNLTGSLSRKEMVLKRLGTLPFEKYHSFEELERAIAIHDKLPVTIHVFDKSPEPSRVPHLQHSFVVLGKNLNNEWICVEKIDTKEGVEVSTLPQLLKHCGVMSTFVVDEKSFPGTV